MNLKFKYDDSLGLDEIAVDLRLDFPRPWRASVRKQFPFIASFIMILAVALIQLSLNIADGIEDGLFFDILSAITFYILFGGIFITCILLMYEEFHHRSFFYGLDSGNLIIVKGVFVKRRSSYPLAKVTDVYLDRGWVDLVFFLYNLNFSTANDKSFEFGRIRGLSRSSAIGLQTLLTKLVGEETMTEAAWQQDPPDMMQAKEINLSGLEEQN